jgi:hypothetical protein
VPLSTLARQFWSAAFFLRRAPTRNPGLALKILGSLASQPPSPVQSRAAQILRKERP